MSTTGHLELSLDATEADLLARIFERYLPELREEVYKTERLEMREALHKDEEALKSLLARLRALRAEHGMVG